MEITLQKAQNAKTIFSAIIIGLLLNSCAAQHVKINDKLAYELLKYHYRDAISNKASGFLYYKTIDPKNHPVISDIDTLTTFVNNNIMDLIKCNMESIFSKEQVSLLNDKYKHLKSLELDAKLLGNADILNNQLENSELYASSPHRATKMITFPVILISGSSIFGAFIEMSGISGCRLFLYKKEEKNWSTLCVSTLCVI